ncbi:MAG: carbamoyl-phosphate synthase large subunit [Fimbriimonadaceae bacterium]|nr:carbamoyl-phosphate synthase large subunit [Fimbriimonadaceae bacterium]
MKVLVIGSGPIVIGQAAEFDYAGTQACKSLKEEGHEVVLINSNPATIMTDPGVADALYIEPLTPEFCERVIAREKPDALLPTLGGQTGLNLATQLADLGILEKYSVKLLGTPLSAIRKAEDREEFRALMREIKEPVPESFIIETPEQLKAILDTRIPDENGRLIDFPYPRIVRPAYTLGGTGGGIAHTPEELWEIGQKGLQLSMRSQVMIERSLLGWKEVEYEVMRDSKGNCITICNMENFDPMGVHTGDSIVIAPSQTLSDLEYHMLRTASLKIISSLGIEGGCNVQLAINPDSFDYYVIEVNPRVSRSSALASKATGYPIARVAAKIAVGKTLDEIENQVTKSTKACFEPALDYCVVKIPRWPFDKFTTGDRSLFTQMKATGEVMAIDRTFEAAFLKAIRGLEVKQKDLRHAKFMGMEDAPLAHAIQFPTDERLWAIAEGLRRGWGVDEVNRLSNVDKWFLTKMQGLLDVEQRLVKARETNGQSEPIESLVREAFLIGFPSPTIMSLLGIPPGLGLSSFVNDMPTDQEFETALKAHADFPNLSSAQLEDFVKRFSDKVTYHPSPFLQFLKSNEISFSSAESIFLFESLRAVERLKTKPVFKMVDTCAAEFESATPYYYGTFEQDDDATRNLTELEDTRKTVLVLGSGPIRIGQGIEFDYSCVHCVWALEEMGYRAVIVNNNPETVSTDFDTGDGLYFEPVTLEDTMDIVRHEQPIGAVVQFGGQTAINLAQGLHDQDVSILGTSAAAIAMAEDRDLFEKLMTELDIAKPAGRAVRSYADAVKVAQEVGYPVLVRPSFVLGGRAMEIVFDEEQLEHFYREAEDANPGQPVLVDKYLLGIEAEVDVISDGVDTLVPGIMEHIERAGVHSGDSMAVYPAVHLSEEIQAQMVVSACKIARALKIKGLMNIQFVIAPEGPPPPTPSTPSTTVSSDGTPTPHRLPLAPSSQGEGKLRAYVLEVNPRGSRTVPYISKVTGIPMVDLATRCMMGQTLKGMGYGSGLWTLDAGGTVEGMSPKPHAKGRIIPENAFINGEQNLIPEPSLYAIKAPVFSFQKLGKVEPSLGPEMKSTGEILGVDKTYESALYKALIASHINFKAKGYVLLTVQDPDKPGAIEIARKLVAKGFKIAATGGTHDALSEAGIESRWVMKISEGEPNLLDLILKADVSLMINTPSNDRQAEEEAARIRRACIETGVACVTNIDTANALVRALDVFENPMKSSCARLEEYFPV